MSKTVKGTISVQGVQPGMTLDQVSKSVGPLYRAVMDDERSRPISIEYSSEHAVGLSIFSTRSDAQPTVTFLHGKILEEDGVPILEVGSSAREVLNILGKPDKKIVHSRQVWSYENVGSNNIGLNFTFENEILIGISTVDKDALESFESLKQESHRKRKSNF